MYSRMCISSCLAQKLAWLDSLQEQLELPEVHISGEIRRLLLLVLVGLYLHQQSDVQMCVLEVTCKLLKRTPTLVNCDGVCVGIEVALSLPY